MGVDALQLRPRGTLGLLDAALRVCGSSTGVWAVTLPASAVLLASLLALGQAIFFGQPTAGYVALVTAAWVLRALSQAAACDYVFQQVLSPEAPTVGGAWAAALRRAPQVMVVAASTLFLDLAMVLLTGGVGLLFLAGTMSAFAVVMRGGAEAAGARGPWSTAMIVNQVLGGARAHAAGVRLLNVLQPVLLLNLHLAATGLLWGAQNLLGLELTLVERFASLDSLPWLALLALTTFVLFEPLRAVAATLLLIDGRIRREGLDVTATLAHLPQRATRRATRSMLVALVVGAWSTPVNAGDSLVERLDALATACDVELAPTLRTAVQTATEPDRSAWSRFVRSLENTSSDTDGCGSIEPRLQTAMEHLASAAAPALASQARDAAEAILAQPEFREAPPPLPPEPKSPERTWWDSLREWLDEALNALMRWLRVEPPAPRQHPRSSFGADAVTIAALVLALFVLLWVVRARRRVALRAAPLTSETLPDAEVQLEGASAHSVATWVSRGEALAREGQFAEAIRHIYLALLSHLHARRYIEYRTTLSNWDYVADFGGPARLAPAFRELTRRFDVVWYGLRTVDASAYADFRALATPLLETNAPERAP